MSMGQRRGFVLITVFLLTSLMLLMVLSLLGLARRDTFGTKTQLDRVAARLVAEAGLAHAIQELTADPEWTAGFLGQPSAFQRGEYSLRFPAAGQTPTPEHSLNNLLSDNPLEAAGLVVPPRSAYLVVTGQVSDRRETVKAMLTRDVSLGSAAALSASGRIDLRGRVSVEGLSSIEGEPLEADVHSNLKSADDNTVTWAPLDSGDRVKVSGKVSSSDADSDTIDFGSDASLFDVTGGFETDALPLSPSPLDVAALVAANSGAPAPGLGGGSGTVAGGVWHHQGDLVINGDLDLESGAELYVSGSLTVNGAIRGQGSVYVANDTTFQGDAFVDGSNRVALLGGGDVNLMGFDGEEYLRGLGPAASEHLDNINTTIATMTDLIDNHSPSAIMGNVGPLDRLKHQISGRPTDESYDPSMPNNQLGRLMEIVEAQPEGPTRTFVLAQMKEYYDLFYWEPGQDKEAGANAFMENPSVFQDFALEAVFDMGAGYYSDPAAALGKVRYVVSNLGYDRLGHSFFQGLVYSNGNIRAQQGVSVIGALVADGWRGARGGTKSLISVVPKAVMRPGILLRLAKLEIWRGRDLFLISSGLNLVGLG
jgi:hypothetical protein